MGVKNSLIIVLMCCSIGLLIALQGLWLLNSYEVEREKFKRETSAIFRSTLISMRDEVIERNVESIDSIPLGPLLKKRLHLRQDIHEVGADTSRIHSHERIEVFISGARDSIGDVLRPLVERLENRDSASRKFVIRLDFDSLKTDSIKIRLSHAYARADIEADFTVLRLNERSPRVAHGSQNALAEIVRLGPDEQYGVAFGNLRKVLLVRIAPQILFCLILTLVIIGSFFVMYRSLVSHQELMVLKNEFINNITHELKTPVATVSVALEALRNFSVLNNRERTEEYLSIAQRELERLSLLTDKILKTSVLENPDVKLDVTSVNLDDVLQKVINNLSVVFTKTDSKIRFEKKGNSFVVNGSEEHLSAVAYNIIDNALKYRRPNCEIVVSMEEKPGHIVILFSDNGIGIPSEFKTKIFDKFFRVPSGDVHNIKGYGLGLNFVASVVAKHGGKISVDSIPNHGSKFIIELPKNENESLVR